MIIKNSTQYNKQKAFTITESIITITIIGFLLICVILIQDFKRQNTIKSQIVQIANFDAVVKQFERKYHSLPGDTTSTVFFGLSKKNSDGNSNYLLEDHFGGNKQASSEIVNFWYHLSNSGLIDKKYDGFENKNAKIGKTFPFSKIGNHRGITVFGYNYKNYYQIGVSDSTSEEITMSDLTLTTKESSDIDIKIDDSIPNTGIVIAVEGKRVNIFAKEGECIKNGEYNRSQNQPSCQLRIEMKTTR